MAGFIFLIYFLLTVYLFYRRNKVEEGVIPSLRDCVYNAASILFFFALLTLVVFDALHYCGVLQSSLHLSMNK
jgi:hypothetical protein